jgi:hypothetical protein
VSIHPSVVVHTATANPAQIKNMVASLQATNPTGAASMASRHIEHFTPAEAAKLLRDLMRTRDPDGAVAEIKGLNGTVMILEGRDN